MTKLTWERVEKDLREMASGGITEEGMIAWCGFLADAIAAERCAGKSRKLGGCCCGEPFVLGVVHRTDGPCFRYVEPTAERAEIARLTRGNIGYAQENVNLIGREHVALKRAELAESRLAVANALQNKD